MSNPSILNIALRFLFTILAASTFFLSNAQKQGDDMVFQVILDSLIKVHNFNFYYEHLQHIETQEFGRHPFDSLTIWKNDSFEEIKKKAIDIKIYYDSINLHESRLFKQREFYPNGLYLLSKIEPNSVHREIQLSKYISLPSYPNIKEVNNFSDSLFDINKLGNYHIIRASEETLAFYKYAIKAFISFSGVVWDKTGTYCMVECGCHYKIPESKPDRGQSGGGFQAILENRSGHLRIIRIIGLWEE